MFIQLYCGGGGNRKKPKYPTIGKWLAYTSWSTHNKIYHVSKIISITELEGC